LPEKREKREREIAANRQSFSFSLLKEHTLRERAWDHRSDRTRETARELSSKFSHVILKKDLVLYASSSLLLLLLGLVERGRAREKREREVIV
jgi:hypothetical protein